MLAECERLVTRSLAAGALEVTSNALDACVASMQQALTGCDWVTPGQPLAPPACRSVLKGKLSLGSVCPSSLECAEPLHCAGVTPSKAGICAQPANIGAACGAPADALAAYTLSGELERAHPSCAEFCSLLSHKCEPLPREGAPCLASVSCASGQSCIAGICAAKQTLARGQACTGATCAEGLHCRDGECRALSEPGEACTTDFDCAKGGCIAGSDDRRTCGAQCSVSLTLLKTDSGPRMRLPLRPQTEASR